MVFQFQFHCGFIFSRKAHRLMYLLLASRAASNRPSLKRCTLSCLLPRAIKSRNEKEVICNQPNRKPKTRELHFTYAASARTAVASLWLLGIKQLTWVAEGFRNLRSMCRIINTQTQQPKIVQSRLSVHQWLNRDRELKGQKAGVDMPLVVVRMWIYKFKLHSC